MELFMNKNYYILVHDRNSLWCSRIDGSLCPQDAESIENLSDCVCLGIVFGLIGKFTVQHDRWWVAVVRERAAVGCLPGGHEVYKVQKVALLPLSQHQVTDIEFEVCRRHRFNPRRASPVGNDDHQQRAFHKTWSTLKAAAAQVKNRKQPKELRDREKLEKRVIEEFTKMFTDTDSFYYSLTGDLTNSVQRQMDSAASTDEAVLPLWRKVDDRFFWNKHMAADLIQANADAWIVPLIQGFVQIEQCWIDPMGGGAESLSSEAPRPSVMPPPEGTKSYTMALLSRRSRHRAGTRYKRRGVDEEGRCANYVETEQLFEYSSHVVSFVQVRGSVPVFWSQPGTRYRPPPRIDRGAEESRAAFERHFVEEVGLYGSQVVVNLMEQTGKEKVIHDAYLDHILHLNSAQLVYVTFDFHEYCRGMRFENVSVLIESIQDVIRDMRYCWRDSEGPICRQQGTFRVNCVDCLDRTNIVQTALAKAVMDIQFQKLGLLQPEGPGLPSGCRRTFQTLWANNGDTISRQYAGTVALKGDFTRTGERRIAGMMKDGYHSASRYYMNRFKDSFRQATIDLMLGQPLTEDIAVSPEEEGEEPGTEEEGEEERHERVRQLIEDCKRILIPEAEVVLGGWALVDADPTTGDTDKQDMDTILILTKSAYFVAEYDDQTDRIVKYQKVFLEDLERLELGAAPAGVRGRPCCLRLHYTAGGQSGYFHMFRSTDTRFFNNVAVPVTSPEEAAEALKAICETFKVSLCVKELNVPIYEGRLERRKSKVPAHVPSGRPRPQAFHLDLPSFASMPRNISEGQLNSLRSVGSRALSRVLHPFRTTLGHAPTADLAAVHEAQNPHFIVESSSDSEEGMAGAAQSATLTSSDDSSPPSEDALLPSCGILAAPAPASGRRRGRSEADDFVLDAMQRLRMPQIHVSTEGNLAGAAQVRAGAARQFSKSSEDLEYRAVATSTEACSHMHVAEEPSAGGLLEVAKMKTSHSESAIQEFSSSSPLAVKRDLLLSPLSRIAKGVQSLGLNLQRHRPRHPEEVKRREHNCATRIIEL